MRKLTSIGGFVLWENNINPAIKVGVQACRVPSLQRLENSGRVLGIVIVQNSSKCVQVCLQGGGNLIMRDGQ